MGGKIGLGFLKTILIVGKGGPSSASPPAVTPGMSFKLINEKEGPESGGWVAPLFLILGIVYHIFHFFYNGWDNLSVGLLASTATVCLIVIILNSVGDYRRGMRNVTFLLIAIGFEVFYYTLLTRFVNPIPWQLSKMLGWNGFIIAAGFAGFSQKKIYFKLIIYYFVILLMMILLSPLAMGLGKGLGWIPTTEVKGGSAEDVLKGVQETSASWIDEITCSMSQSQDSATCVEEKKWEKIRKDKPELAQAMKDLCTQNDPRCDCYVYPAGKERDDCVKKKSEASSARSLEGAAKKLTPIKVDFQAITKESYLSSAWLDFNINILSPNKPIDIALDCSIEYNKTKIESDFRTEYILGVKTDATPLPIRYSCGSKNDVPSGDYKFNLTATIIGITTKATFIGLYTNLMPEARGPQFNTILEGAMKDAYGGTSASNVKSFSDPDPTWLIFKVEPRRAQEKVSILSADPSLDATYKEFILEVSLKKGDTGILPATQSKIKTVESLEFKIPNVFSITEKCKKVYEVTNGENYINISAKKDILNAILSKVVITNEPKVIDALSCDIVPTNPPPITLVTSLIFEGSMKYNQEISKQETVKKI